MITGDHAIIAKETARQLGLGTNIPDANGLPTLGEVRRLRRGTRRFFRPCAASFCSCFRA